MSPTAFITESSQDRRQAVGEASRYLLAGGLVALPMETVYGIAAMLTMPETMRRLKEIKKISGHPGWVIHVADAAEVQRYIRKIPIIAGRIIKKSWPGPVALQVPVSAEDQTSLENLIGPETAAEAISGGFLTFRCPDSAVTREILAAVGGPTVLVGAGDRLAVGEVADIPAAIADSLDAIIDGGPARYRMASTVVRVNGDDLQVMRPGVIDARIVKRMADRVILFVCTGNTCRSPMAAAIGAVQLANKLGISVMALSEHHIVVESAGLYASEGMPATREARAAARELGADLSGHRSRPAGQDVLRRADVIYTMTRQHRDEVIERYPAAADKTFMLDPKTDIEDPIGSDAQRYQQLAGRLENLIVQRIVSGINQ